MHSEINGISDKFNLTFERCKLIPCIYMEEPGRHDTKTVFHPHLTELGFPFFPLSKTHRTGQGFQLGSEIPYPV